MEKIQRKRMLWRIPLVVAILFAIFWGTWYLVTGEIPTTTQIRWNEDTNIQLPFAVSRAWDILIAPFWAMILILLFTNNRIRKDKDLVASLVVGLVLGLISGLVFGLIPGLVVGLISGLVFGLIPGLVVGLIFSLVVGLIFSLVVGLKFLFSRKFWRTVGHWLSGK